MSEEQTSQENNNAPSADDGEISLENLDSMIEAEAPGFGDEMSAISKEGEGVDYSEIEIESEVTSEDGDEEELDEGKKSLFLRIKERFPRLFKYFGIFKPLENIYNFLISKVRYYSTFFKNKVYRVFHDLVVFFKNDLPQMIKAVVASVKAFFASIKNFLFKFKSLSWTKKAQVVFFIALAGASVFLVKRTITGGWLGLGNTSLIIGFHEVADKVYEFDEKMGIDSFYSSFPQQEHNLLLKPIKVDLKRHNRFETPMGAFEIYINLDSKETAVEVKDREKEFLDLSQRVFEEYYYKEIQSIEGKAKLKEVLKREMNLILNKGRVKKIYFKLFITKP